MQYQVACHNYSVQLYKPFISTVNKITENTGKLENALKIRIAQ